MRKNMLSTAIMIAALAHHEQFDKGGEPYLLHPLAVKNILASEDEEEQVVAVLHDVLEDSDVTEEELRSAGISEKCIRSIKCLTKIKGQTYEEYKEAVFSDEIAMKVKKADLTHNSDLRRMKGITEKDIARSAKYQRFYFEINERLKK